MHAPGVEVRPLVQITGQPEFNEIFFTDVRVPKENVLGAVGDGWQVAMTTLLHERGTLGFALAATLDVAVRELAALAKERGVTDPILRDRLAREWIELQALKYTNYRSLSTLQKTGIPGPEGSTSKLVWSENNQRLTKLALEILGSHAQLTDGGGLRRRVLAVPAAPLAREHDRSGDERDSAQHRRRARARDAEESGSGLLVHARAGRPPARGALVPRSEPVAVDGAAHRARVGRDPAQRRLRLSRRGGAVRGAWPLLYDGPFVLNEVAAQPGDDVWSIEVDGFVPHLAQVQRVLTPAMEAAAATGETIATVDETLQLGRLSRNGVERAEGDWPEVRRRLLAALALEAVGIGSKANELAIDYVKEREQFGKKIGTYQAISHSLVDGYVAVELARSLAYWAAWAVAEGDAQADLAVAAAKSQAAEAAVQACERSIQAHGGIGFTWEHPLHRYYKRALWLEGALGYGREQRAEIAAFLLDS